MKCVNGMDYCRRSIAGQLKCPSDGSSCGGDNNNALYYDKT